MSNDYHLLRGWGRLYGSAVEANSADGGATWTLGSVPAGNAFGLSSLACGSATTCYASRRTVLRTRDNQHIKLRGYLEHPDTPSIH